MTARLALVVPHDTYRAAPFIAAADALGVDTTVVTDRPLALTTAMVVDLDDPLLAAKQITERHFDAVIGVDGVGVRIAAHADRRNPIAAVEATFDKLHQRELWAASGVRQPRFGHGDIRKPRRRSGSVGVTRLAEARSLISATELTEEFIDGPEVCVEALVDDGTVHVLAIFDKPNAGQGPTFPETLLVQPSRRSPREQYEIEHTTTQAISALGLRHGPVHAELRGCPPRMIELHARSIGGRCSQLLTFADGSTLESNIIRQALGWPFETMVANEPSASGVWMLPVPARGRLDAVRTAVDQTDAASASVEITIPIGDIVVPLPHGDRYLGFVFAHGSSAEAVEAQLRAAVATIEVVVDGRSYQMSNVIS